MTYDQIIEQIKQHPNQFGYALDYTGWYLYILDPADETYPEPVAYDIQLDEYRDAVNIPKLSRAQTGWWLSYTKPDAAIDKWLAVNTPDIHDMLAEWRGMPQPESAEPDHVCKKQEDIDTVFESITQLSAAINDLLDRVQSMPQYTVDVEPGLTGHDVIVTVRQKAEEPDHA